MNSCSGEQPALFRAVRAGQHKCVKYLIKAGADVNITYKGKQTVLHAVFDEYTECPQCDISHLVDWPGVPRSVRSVLNAGPRMNMKNASGSKPLSLYISQDARHKRCLESLCQKEIAHLLVVAGETSDEGSFDLLNREERLLLKHICRDNQKAPAEAGSTHKSLPPSAQNWTSLFTDQVLAVQHVIR